MKVYSIEFKPSAVKDLKKLPSSVRKRIGLKLDYFRLQPDPLVYATKLAGFSKGGDYQFQIGQYRIVFDLEGFIITILYIEHRRVSIRTYCNYFTRETYSPVRVSTLMRSS